MKTQFFETAKRLFYPQRCAYCGRVIDPFTELCDACAQEVCRVPPPICFACARSKKDCDCGGAHNRFVTAFAAPFYFDGSVRTAIHRLKFSGDTDVAAPLSREMANFACEVFAHVQFDCATFVPMTDREQKERGFNQSRLLCVGAAKALGIPTQPLLCKLYETRRQRELSRWERSGNVLGVFDVVDPSLVAGKRILLCDDVTTSRSTLTECAKMLRIYGAREVFCLTAAVVSPRDNRKG